ncbi:MAG TPA: SDR family oxidoreductase [Acidimicrobiales bacterium]|nr:SDR family oxidoreductase [Acidimicrobiales bacterium]
MDLELEGKVVLVTGGTSGLGRALCGTLMAEGARVAFCGRNPEALDTVTEELTAGGGEAIGIAADVTVPADLEAFVAAAVGRWGQIDGVVNNAGRGAAMPVDRTTDEIWDDDLHLKLYAAVRLVRLTLPHLRASKGAVVNTLNTSSKAPGPASGPSSVSRAAGLALTKMLSKELGPDGVRVNAVCNGLLESPQWTRDAAAEGITIDEMYERLAARVPLGRVGLSREYAEVVTFLLSPRASYLSGAALNLDGGLCAVV